VAVIVIVAVIVASVIMAMGRVGVVPAEGFLLVLVHESTFAEAAST
jgi:hypothetical protein